VSGWAAQGILLLAGLCGLLTADLIYGILNSAGSFTTGGVADAFWLSFYVLVAAAALHPDMARPIQGRRRPLGMTRPGVVALCLATLSVPILDLIWGRPADKLFTTLCSCLLFLLVTTRLVAMVGVIQSQERQARHNSLHDALTGLPNRVLFVQHVQEYAEQNPQQQAAVLYIDLDGFKQVNDTLGHDIGDQLLVAVGQRLIAAVRDFDLVARLSGDEFAVLLRHTSGPADAITIADRIHAHLAAPIALAHHTLTTTASIGISAQSCATFPGTEVILKAADTAMYQAKATGRGRHSLLPTPSPALLSTP
jgi:diguanylate cyclase (GGDEF)-like protein